MRERIKYYLSLLDPQIAAGYLRVPRRDAGDAAQALRAAIDWICRAQDAAGDGGVARSFSLVYNAFFRKRGWTASYPETTGYIIPTLFDYARASGRGELLDRAVRMADWECEVQMPSGAVQGGTVNEPPSPAVFNTGQVIFGWVRAFKETGTERYLQSAIRAGDFLLSCQDADGAWRKQLSKFASQSMPFYIYNVRSAWALLQLGEVAGDRVYRDAAVRNIDFALGEQLPNGWFRNNCLNDPDRPLLHTIAYTLEGMVEAGISLGEARYISAVRKAADELLARLEPDGRLAGRFDRRWEPAANYCCLTGNAQMGIVWGRLYQATGDDRYVTGMRRTNEFLRKLQWMGTGNPDLEGGISGSFPLHGRYGSFEILNWAVKFFVDSMMLEASICGRANSEQSTLVPRPH
jgi:uncharacterized protein YyaL (SSP411 family)